MGNSPTGPADIVNRAIVLMGGFDDNKPLTGTPASGFDGTPLGQAAAIIYGDIVQTVGKQFGWDFARNIATLAPSGGTPPPWWAFEYVYPSNGIEVRKVVASIAPADPNNPVPVRMTIANNTVASIALKVIWCNVPNALAIISSQPPEPLWDAAFIEAVVRGIASALGMGNAGRPETAQLELERSGAILAVGKNKAG
jgi:hypothetical protein